MTVDDTDRQTFAAMYEHVHIATRNRDQVTAKVIAIYFHALSPLPTWAVKEASENLILNSKFPPTTADWRLEAERILTTRSTPRMTTAAVSMDPKRVANIRAAKQQCVESIRAKPPHPDIDWQRIATVVERIPIAVPPHVHCSRCQDTGWEPSECRPGQRCGRQTCETADDSVTHSQVGKCACLAANPIIQSRFNQLEETKATRQLMQRRPR